MICNECSFRIFTRERIARCIHPKARMGEKPFPNCKGDLWQKEAPDSSFVRKNDIQKAKT
jgi:hypothetical protein